MVPKRCTNEIETSPTRLNLFMFSVSSLRPHYIPLSFSCDFRLTDPSFGPSDECSTHWDPVTKESNEKICYRQYFQFVLMGTFRHRITNLIPFVNHRES